MDKNEAQQQFAAILAGAVDSLGGQLAETPAELADYMAERAEHLSLAAGEPGFAEAVQAEQDAIALRAGLIVSDSTRVFDQHVWGLIGGALRIAAVALV